MKNICSGLCKKRPARAGRFLLFFLGALFTKDASNDVLLGVGQTEARDKLLLTFGDAGGVVAEHIRHFLAGIDDLFGLFLRLTKKL